MATTYTTNKAIGEPANGDTGWGTTVNASLSQVDTAFGGSTSLVVTGLSGNQTLTTAQYSPLTLNISGTLTANVTYVVPSGVGGQWMVYNGATGAFTVSIASAAGGPAVAIPANSLLNVTCDGTSSGMRFMQAVSSVAMSTSLSGLSVGGSPVTSSGTFALSGTLGIPSGGTGQTTASAAFNALSPVTSAGDLIIGTGTSTSGRLAIGANGYILTSNGTTASWQPNSGGGGGGGTVTSVALSSGLSGVTVTGSPITTSGTFSLGGTLGSANGGTGLSSFTSGGALYALSTTALTTGTLPVSAGGTGVTTSTGTGSVVLSNSPTLTTPALGTPSALVLTNATGTPASIGLANGTGLPLSTGVTGTLAVGSGGTGVTTSTGTGSVVLSNSPTLTTPNIGAATATSVAASGNITAANGTTGTQVVNYSQFGSSISSNGYTKLPNGLIIQWGSGATSSGSGTVTFPISFPSACYNVQLTLSGGTTPGSIYALISGAPSTSSVAVYCQPSATLGFFWVAIGS